MVKRLGQKAEVEIVGLKDTIRVLKELDKEYARDLQADFDGMAHEVMGGAYILASQLPSNIRDARYEVAKTSARGKLLGARSRAASFGMVVRATSRDAAIAEFAGKPGNIKTPQGAALVKNLDAAIGRPGRILWESWDQRAGDLEPAIRARVTQAEHHAQRLFDTARDREMA